MSQIPDSFGCVSNTIKVAAGHYVDLIDTDPYTIDINSIASALSKICRFGGHSPRFYSVAEHCILATRLAKKHGIDLEALRAIFLHDAAEAYIGDMVKPLKLNIPKYRSIETQIEHAIQIAFAVDFEQWADVIKEYDRAMLKAEKTRLWPEDKEVWAGFSSIPDHEVEFRFYDWITAEHRYLELATELNLACSQDSEFKAGDFVVVLDGEGTGNTLNDGELCQIEYVSGWCHKLVGKTDFWNKSRFRAARQEEIAEARIANGK